MGQENKVLQATFSLFSVRLQKTMRMLLAILRETLHENSRCRSHAEIIEFQSLQKL